MPTNVFYKKKTRLCVLSLSQSQKEYARRRAPKKRGRRRRERFLESEIGGVFVVFVGGGDLRNVFFLEAIFVTV